MRGCGRLLPCGCFLVDGKLREPCPRHLVGLDGADPERPLKPADPALAEWMRKREVER